MTLRLEIVRFEFVALDEMRFPPGKAANVFRGALGLALHRIAGEEAYARLFSPHAGPGSPSGFADPPRPFVLRVRQLDGARIERGSAFSACLHLFDTRDPAVELWRQAMSGAAMEGLGPGNGRARLMDVESRTVEQDLAPVPRGAREVRVVFHSPTELKSGGRLMGAEDGGPPFDVLFARCRDRIGGLASLYGDGPLILDFRALGERARSVRVLRSNLRHVARERRSGNTGQVHPLGGFTGEAEYAGGLDEFLPFLEAAAWTGVGRQTVWGKGEISIHARY